MKCIMLEILLDSVGPNENVLFIWMSLMSLTADLLPEST